MRMVAIGALALLCALPGPGHAVPADPDRPLAAQTCHEAQERLAEALQGSPLLSPEEQAAVVRVARSNVERLCETGTQEGRDPGQTPSLGNARASAVLQRGMLRP